MNPRIRHDVAWATARKILGMIANCLREEERRDALEEVYLAVKEALEKYDTAVAKEAARLGG